MKSNRKRLVRAYDKGLIVEVGELTIKFNYEDKEYEIWVGNR